MPLTDSRSRFHHTGYVVPSIAGAVAGFQSALFLDWDGVIVEDPLQMVRVTFLPANLPGQTTIELVEPAGPRSPVLKFLESAAGIQSGGIHHVCFEVEDLKTQLAEARAAGHTMVRVPMPATAFGGRRIAWVRTPSGILVEYLQR
jgi:methylmalonyl-CoA/ethylmalonyl-CoA epimerase